MTYIETPETNALKQHIETILAKVPDFVEPAADEKQKQRLKINVIKDCAERGDIKLIAPLLKNPTVKKVFFTPVLNSFVFNTAKFKEFLEYSSACNSYSKYLGQKIGLYMGDIPLIDRSEVVLNFPFKDCVLEGAVSVKKTVWIHILNTMTKNMDIRKKRANVERCFTMRYSPAMK